jgi:hypothetical protein
VYVDITKKTKVPRAFNSALSVSATEFGDPEAQIPPFASQEETSPLLPRKINPDAAINYRSITLPSSSALTRQRKSSEKKKKPKEFFEASTLATNLYSDGRLQSVTQVPEIRLSDPEMDI